MHNRLKTGRAQCIHARTERPYTRQDDGVSRGGYASVCGQDSVSTHTFKGLLRRTQISDSVIKHRNARA
jgi:hypothetical protein